LVTPNQPVFCLKKDNKLYVLKFFENKYACYSSSKIEEIAEFIPDEESKYVLTKITNSHLKSYTLEVVPISHIISDNKLWEKPIYNINSMEKSSVFSWLLPIILISMLTLIFIFIAVKKMNASRNKNSQKTLIWSDFDEKEQQAIHLLLSSENGIEISQLNDLFGDLEIGFEALKKRREHFIKDLKMKMAEKSGFGIDELFIEFKNPNDKRIKVLHLKKKLDFRGKMNP